MPRITDYPLLVFVLAAVVLWIAELAGVSLRRIHQGPEKDEREDLGMLLAGALTLLGLIIGFTFSMAVARYDQRKSTETTEAVSIGAENLKADLLPTEDDARNVHQLLRRYLDQRVLFYAVRDSGELDQIEATTAQLERDLWSAIRAPIPKELPPLIGVTVGGMTDIFNARVATRSAWTNRIPAAAWLLMLAISICCTALVGYSAQRTQAKPRLLMILPVIVAIAFFLIADIDSPRRGIIRVQPINLQALAQSLQ
jgi:hypothetical protein